VDVIVVASAPGRACGKERGHDDARRVRGSDGIPSGVVLSAASRVVYLPLEQPTTFELILNVKTGCALGLTFPPSLLIQAEQLLD
jgi:hypothetical protein